MNFVAAALIVVGGSAVAHARVDMNHVICTLLCTMSRVAKAAARRGAARLSFSTIAPRKGDRGRHAPLSPDTVTVAMSGGVDSSVAAALLARQVCAPISNVSS